MIERDSASRIIASLNSFPIVGLLGARQVGKTTLAKKIRSTYKKKTIYLDLELTTDLLKLNEPELYLKQHENELVIIDEIQRKPNLFPLIRALIDQNRVPGRFLILGSASIELLKQSSESLAGRIIYHELSPLCLSEIDKNRYQDLWLRGGFPESYLAKNDTPV